MKLLFRDKKSSVVIIIVFLFMLAFNFMTPYIADDYNYAFNWSTDQLLQSFPEVIDSMVVHWLYWHGRVIANGFASWFMIYPKTLFNIVNAAVSTAIMIMVYIIVKSFSKNKNVSLPLCIVAMMLWNFVPSFGQVFLWLDGSCNYSWTLFFELLFLVPYFKAYADELYKPSIIYELFLFVEAFIAGAYNEAGSISAIFVAGCILVLMLIYKKKPSIALLFNLCSAVGGFIWLMSAPSFKTGHRGSFSIELVQEKMQFLLSKFDPVILEYETTYLTIIALISIVAFALLFAIKCKRKLLYASLFSIVTAATAFVIVLTIPQRYSSTVDVVATIQTAVSAPEGNVILANYIFFSLVIASLYYRIDSKIVMLVATLFFGALGSAVSFLFAAYIPTRGFVYMILYLSIGSALLVDELVQRESVFIVKSLCGVISAVFLISFTVGTIDLIHMAEQKIERNSIIAASIEDGRAVTELPIYTYTSKYSPAYELVDVNPEQDWPCGAICDYYSLNSVVGVER